MLVFLLLLLLFVWWCLLFTWKCVSPAGQIIYSSNVHLYVWGLNIDGISGVILVTWYDATGKKMCLFRLVS